jgi:hypothetical protein
MFVMYNMAKKMSQFGDWKAQRGTTNLNVLANEWKVIRAVVFPKCMMRLCSRRDDVLDMSSRYRPFDVSLFVVWCEAGLVLSKKWARVVLMFLTLGG